MAAPTSSIATTHEPGNAVWMSTMTVFGDSVASISASQADRYADSVLRNSPVVYYRLAERGLPGERLMADSSGNGRPALYSDSGNVTQGTPSAVACDDAAASSTGTAPVGTRDDGSFLPSGDAPRTLEAWYRSTNTDRQPVIGYGTAGAQNAFGLAVNSHNVIMDTWAGDPHFTTEANIQDGQWHHVVITYDGTDGRAYLDGTQLGSALPFAINTNANAPLFVGGWLDTAFNQPLVGSVDEVAIYDTALSAADIAAHYAAAIRDCPSPPTKPNLAVVDASAEPGSAAAGASAPVSWTTRNVGSAEASGTWNDAVYLSADEVLDEGADDRVLLVTGSGPLAAGQQLEHSTEVNLPQDVAAGQYFLLVRTDDGEHVEEANEEDNVVAVPFTVTAVPDAAGVVNTVEDHAPGPCQAAPGDCTLREAINQANADPDHSAISFAIPGDGVKRITLASELPPIAHAVTIDGFTQPGASAGTLPGPTDDVLVVELDGSASAVPGSGIFHGLQLNGGASTVKGLVVNGFAGGWGIVIAGAGNRIESCFLGTDAAGTTPVPNGGGIELQSSSNTLLGSLVSGNQTVGVRVAPAIPGGADGNVIQGNWIGSNAAGTQALANGGEGILLQGASNTLVGGPVAFGQRNLISGNGGAGIALAGGATANTIDGNVIGLNASYDAPLPNEDGIVLDGADGNTIGVGVDNNVVSGNRGAGIHLFNGADRNIIDANWIGLAADGLGALGNTGAGIRVESSADTQIVGNVVSANAVGIRGVAATGTTIFGNHVGTNVDGSVDRGNLQEGIFISGTQGPLTLRHNLVSGNGAAGVRLQDVGGAPASVLVIDSRLGTNLHGTERIANDGDGLLLENTTGVRVGGSHGHECFWGGNCGNLVSGNGGFGMALSGSSTGTVAIHNWVGPLASGVAPNALGGVEIAGDANRLGTAGTHGENLNLISGNGGPGILISGNDNEIGGNLIGTTADGQGPLANTVGVRISGGARNVVDDNLVSGNTGAGVALAAGAAANVVKRNAIGLAWDTGSPLGNGGDGIEVESAVDSRIQGNRIAHNGGDGVSVAEGIGNSIRVHAPDAFVPGTITANGGVAIDLGADGVTRNDADDADGGANALQNFPVLTAVEPAAGGASVEGALDGVPGRSYAIELFANEICDASDHGEARRLLGVAEVTTGADGIARFTAPIPEQIPDGTAVAATATDVSSGDTSELSRCSGTPNLTVDAAEVTPPRGTPGESVNVSWRTRNASSIDIYRGFSEAVYLSDDRFLDVDGRDRRLTRVVFVPACLEGRLCSPFLAAASERAGSSEITVPEVPPGDYFLLARTDDGEVVHEADETDNVASIEFEVLPAELTVTKTADDSQVAPGAADGYTITLSNPNAAPASVASITDDLPDGFSYAGPTTGDTTSDPTREGQKLTWTGPFQVPANGSFSLHFGVTAATGPGTYSNTASALDGTGATVATTGPTAQIVVQEPQCVTPADPAFLVPRGACYRYKQVAGGELPGFEAEGYDDSGWAVGAAPFGNGHCDLPFATRWEAGTPEARTNLLARRSFTVPPGTDHILVRVVVDNDVTVHVNGNDIGSAEVATCAQSVGPFRVDAADLHLGAENVLAVRASDYGVATYLDVDVTAVASEPSPPSCVTPSTAGSAIGGAQTWRLADDFGASNENPTPDSYGNAGIWHFCSSADLTHGGYTKLPTFSPDPLGLAGQVKGWHGAAITCAASPDLPIVLVNTGETTSALCEGEGITFPGDSVLVHPTPSKMAIVAWRSPVTGLIAISGGVSDLDPDGGDGVEWSIVGRSITSATGHVHASGAVANGGSESFSSGLVLAANAGDVLYFGVSPGAAGDDTHDSTRLDVTITLLDTGAPSAILVSKLADSPTSEPGGGNGYTITIVNPNPEAVVLDAITDMLPAGFTYVPESTSGDVSADPVIEGRTLTWAGPVLVPASGSISFDFAVDVSDTPGDYFNEADAEAGSFPVTPTGPTAKVTVTEPRVDLSIEKVGRPNPVRIGSELTYEIEIENRGAPATDVSVSDDLADGVVVVSATASAGGTCAQSGDPLVCTWPSLATDETVTATIMVRVPGSPTTLTNTATVSSAGIDEFVDDNTVTITTDVREFADLALTKDAAPNPGNIREALTYTLTATNDGPDAATNVVVSDDLIGEGYVVERATPSQGTCNVTQFLVSCAVGTILPDGVVTVTIEGRGVVAGDLINHAAVLPSDDTHDPDQTNNVDAETVRVIAPADISVTKIDSPDPVAVGEPVTYTLTVHNAGPETATGVRLEDVLPEGTTLSGDPQTTQGFCDEAADVVDTVTCHLGDIPAGADVTVTLQVLTSEPGTLTNTVSVTTVAEDPNPDNNTDTEQTTVFDPNDRADLSILKTGPETATVGVQTTYTVLVQNHGPASATNLVVSDPLPAGMRFDSASADCSYDHVPHRVTCTRAGLPASDSWTVLIHVTPTAPGPAINTATVTGDEPDPVPANNSSTTTTTVRGAPTVSLGADQELLEGDAGTTHMSFTVRLNEAQTTDTEVTVSTADGSAEVADGDYTPLSNRPVVIPAGETSRSLPVDVHGDTKVEPDEVFAVRIVSAPVTIERGAATGTIRNDDEATGVADITVGKLDVPDPVALGGQLSYHLRVFNWGPQPATDVVLEDELPADVTLVSVSTTQGTCETDGPLVRCMIGTLAPIQDENVLIVVTAPTSPTTLTNTARASTSAGDPVLGNNADTVTTEVRAIADVSVTKSDDPDPVAVGEQLTYTLTVANAGPQAATGVTLSDQLPADFAVTETDASQGSCSLALPVLTCELGTIASGANATVILRGTPTAPGELVNEANVAGTEHDSNPFNNRATTRTNVAEEPEVPEISIGDVDELEGHEGTKAFRFTVTRSAGAGTSSFHFETIAASAQAGSDYVARSGDRTFSDGQQEMTIEVPVNGDRTFELDESFIVRLSGPQNASFAKADGSGLIRNDDGEPRFSIDDVSELEGPAGTPNDFVFTITKVGDTDVAASVQFQTQNGSAQAPSDYAAASGSRSFAPSESSQQVVVTVNGDGADEPDETFTVALTAPTNTAVEDGTGVGTIRNDDAAPCAPTIRTLSNGDPATTDGALRVPLDGLGAAGDESVGTALYNPPGGLAARSSFFYGGLYASNKDEFLADCLSADATVVSESTSSLTTSAQVGDLGLVLTQSVGAPAADGSSSLTQRYAFTNTTASPQPLTLVHLFDGDLRFLNGRFSDGMVATADGSKLTILDTANQAVANPYVSASGDLDGDATPDTYTGQPYDYRPTVVQRDGIRPDDTGVIFGDENGDGRADVEDDFTGARESRLTLGPGETKTLTVVLTFGLEPANQQPLANDDHYTTDEGSVLTVPARGVLENDTDADRDGLAAVHVDGPENGTLTLNPDGSFVYTPNEGFNGTDTFVYRANDSRASSNFATVTIRVRPRIDVVGDARDEGTGGLTPFELVVRLTGPTSEPVAVDFGTIGGSAEDALDFHGRTGTVTFTPGGPLSETVTVHVVADDLDEFDEEFLLRLDNPRGASLRNNEATGLIRDDDDPPAVEIGNVTITEGDVGTTPAQFKIVLDFPSGKPITVPYSTADNTATVGDSDYRAARGNVTFAPGDILELVTVGVVGDTRLEPNETFFMNLGAADNAPVLDSQGVGTIRNDDSAVVVPPGAGCDHPATIRGTEGNDSLVGTPGDDIICAGGGVDRIQGLGGDDLILGGRGIDEIFGGDGNDTLLGEAEFDTIQGDSGNDVLDGGSGNDRLSGGGGDDLVKGGPATDIVEYGAASAPIELDLATGVAAGQGRDTLTELEVVNGSAQADRLLGDALANGFHGNAGADEIDGRGGDDAIFGDRGDDELYAGGGLRNALLGGPGSDFCQLAPGGGFLSSCERGPASQAARSAAATAPVNFTSSFTAPNEVRAKTIAVSRATASVQVLAGWEDPAAAFGATVELVETSGRTVARGLASVGKVRPRKVVKLAIKATRGPAYLALEARVPARLRSGKKPLRLRVKLRAKSLSRPTSVSTTIAQRRSGRTGVWCRGAAICIAHFNQQEEH